jgi:hypothetical protein
MSSKFLELSALPAYVYTMYVYMCVLVLMNTQRLSLVCAGAHLSQKDTSQEIGQFFPLGVHSNRQKCERKRKGLLNSTAYSLNVFPLVLFCPTSSPANKQMKERNSGHS